MADAAIGTDTTNGGDSIISGDKSGAIILAGYIKSGVTTIKPGYCVQFSGTSTSSNEFDLCNSTQDTNVCGIILEDGAKDIDTAFAAGSYVRVALGNCICRTFAKENIAAILPGDHAIVSAEDGIVAVDAATNTDNRLMIGRFTKYTAKDTQYLVIQHVYLP